MNRSSSSADSSCARRKGASRRRKRGKSSDSPRCAAAPACAVTWADVNALKDEANSLDDEKAELQAQLDALADDKSQAVARKELLDRQKK